MTRSIPDFENYQSPFSWRYASAGGIIHLGATSTDIEDNTDVIRIHQALTMIIAKLSKLLALFSEKISEWADIPITAFTHLQLAEPSTLGFRFAFYAQDLIMQALEGSSYTATGIFNRLLVK